MAKLSAKQTYRYPIDDVFKTITDSILKQMKGKGKKNNISLTSPAGKVSDYTIKRGTKDVPVHFEVTEYEKPTRFVYSMAVQKTQTIIKWELEEFDATTTHVVYSEETPVKSFIYTIFGLMNRNKFRRSSDTYFYQIDAVLEKQFKK